MDIKAILLAFVFGSIILLAMLLPIADMSRPTTYNASLGANNTLVLNNMFVRLNATLDKTSLMRDKLNNASLTMTDTSTFGWVFRSPALFAVGVSTLQLIFDLPDIVGSFMVLVMVALPYNIGFVIVGVGGIIGLIVVFAIIKTLTGVDP